MITSRVVGLIAGGLTLLAGWLPGVIFLMLGSVTLTSCGSECGSLWVGALVSGVAWVLGVTVAAVGTGLTWRSAVVGLWGVFGAVLTAAGAIYAMTTFTTEFIQ